MSCFILTRIFVNQVTKIYPVKAKGRVHLHTSVINLILSDIILHQFQLSKLNSDKNINFAEIIADNRLVQSVIVRL